MVARKGSSLRHGGEGSLERRASRWGVALRYNDFQDETREVGPEVVERALDLMRADGDGPPASDAIVVRKGTRRRLGKGTVELEDGGSIPVTSTLPATVPLGYHCFVDDRGRTSQLIVAPPRCYLPRGLHEWGWAVQVYALHSSKSWGIGDLDDLAALGKWASSAGAGAIMVNPLHAATPGPHPQPSPYSPGSRLFRDPLYISVEGAARALGRTGAISRWLEKGRRLTDAPLIERDGVQRVKMDVLEKIWRTRGNDPAFDRFRKARGRSLEAFATYTALAEVYGSDWHAWPRAYSKPNARAVAGFRKQHADRVEFYSWLQYVADSQLENAARTIGLVGDLAVGVDPNGPDAWMFQDTFAMDARVGAPPDEFNLRGQDWGLLPFDPHKLAASGYRPFIEMVRANLRHVAGLRLDHVMGLWRLYWVIGDDPTIGTYVRYPSRELLDIVCLESVRARAFIVGEDLGTVEPEVRREMAARMMLSYRILWFEDQPPSEYPRLALAAISNHDLPTVTGVWTRRDVRMQRRLGIEPNEAGEESVRRRARKLAHVRSDAPPRKVIERLYQQLGTAPSALTLGTLEDACGVVARQNYPGTNAKENWSRRIPLSVEQLGRSKRVAAVVDALNRGRSKM